MSILKQEFYQRSTKDVAGDLLGKYLVHDSPEGRLSAMITGVVIDPKLKVSSRRAGIASISRNLNIKKKYQIAVTVGVTPELRSIIIYKAIPEEGIEIMKQNFGGEIFNDRDITRSPGSLCKSFGITAELDSMSLVSSNLSIEDREVRMDPDRIATHQDKKQRWRFFMK